MKKISLIFVFVLFSMQGFAQNYLQQTLKSYQNPDQLVTMSPTISFNQAVELLNKVSLKITGKNIVSTVSIDTAIGVEIQNMNYMKALTLLVKMEGLYYDETTTSIIVKRSNVPEEKRTKDNYVPINAREVNISAVFFEEDVSKSKERGIDWQTMFQRQGLNVGGLMGNSSNVTTGSQISTGTTSTGSSTSGSSSSGSSSGTSTTSTTSFNLSATSDFSLGGFFGKATAIFRFFENQNLGNIVSSPNVTVLDGTEARLQDGQDIGIKQRDFSGNVIENFYSTGSIVTVKPNVITEDGIKYILLNIHVERSSFVPDPNNTIINKTSANTRVVLLNGEETVIGGMFYNQVTTIRNGVPILKDLPWWVFGLRYIFGSDSKQISKKELVILIKASLVPTIKERFNEPARENALREELNKQREKMDGYQQLNQSNKDDK